MFSPASDLEIRSKSSSCIAKNTKFDTNCAIKRTSPFALKSNQINADIKTEKVIYTMPGPLVDSLPTNEAKVGFKDLCAEDKQRIANLIKELAR